MSENEITDAEREANRNHAAIIDKMFKHQIGDMVVLRSDAEHWLLDIEVHGPHTGRPGYGEIRNTLHMSQVVERIVQQCHGGVQTHYSLRRYTKEGSSILANHASIEVISRAEAVEIMRLKFPDSSKIESEVSKLEDLEHRIENLRLRAEAREAAAKKKSETP